MKWVQIRGKNADFGKPRDWDETRDGPCGTLPVRVEQEGIYNSHYSAWKPDAAELARLNAGGVIELCCVGIQPPVSLAVVNEHKRTETVSSRPVKCFDETFSAETVVMDAFFPRKK